MRDLCINLTISSSDAAQWKPPAFLRRVASGQERPSCNTKLSVLDESVKIALVNGKLKAGRPGQAIRGRTNHIFSSPGSQPC